MFKSEFQRRPTAILESNFKTKIQVKKQEKNMHSIGLQPKLRDAYVFVGVILNCVFATVTECNTNINI